jgi:hypothetical protein
LSYYPIKYDNISELKGSFFALSRTDGKNLYFFIQDVKGNDVYLAFCESFYFFNKYIERGGASINIDNGDISKVITGRYTDSICKENEFSIRAVMLPIDKLIDKNGDIKINGSISIDSLVPSKVKVKINGTVKEVTRNATTTKNIPELDKDAKYNISGYSNLIKTDDGSRLKIKNIDSLPSSVAKYGGFTNISKIGTIGSTKIVK